MGELLNHLDFWLAIFALGAMVYYLGWKDHIQPFIQRLFPPEEEDVELAPSRRRPDPRRRIPIRRSNGQLAGSFRLGTNAERRSEDRSAVESGGTTVTTVPVVPLSVPEMLMIAVKLAQGMAPNEVAKSLPGYSGRKYNEYVERVRQVKTLLDEQGVLTPVASDQQ